MIGHAIPLGMGTATRAAPAFSESGTAAAAATALVDGLLGGILNLSGFCRRIGLGFEGNRHVAAAAASAARRGERSGATWVPSTAAFFGAFFTIQKVPIFYAKTCVL